MDFTKRTFQKPMVRLLSTTVKTKGSYTFEVFAYEGSTIRQFNVRFLPNKEFFLINFVKKSDLLSVDSESVQKIVSCVEKLFSEFRAEWEGKKSIAELTLNFLALLIENQKVAIPKEVLDTLKGEVIRIFKNTEVCKLDRKGRPYFSSARFGKFFITDIGTITAEDFERNGLVSKR